MSGDIVGTLKSLEDRIISLQGDVVRRWADKDLQDALAELICENIEALAAHFNILTQEIQNSKFSEDLETHIEIFTSQIEYGFRNLAQEMSSVIQNASIDRASTQEEFERQVWQLKRSNGEYLSALNRLGSLHGARDIVDLEEQIEVVSQSVEDEIEQQARQAELKEMKAQQDEDNPEHETDVPQPVKSEAPEAKQEIKSAPHTAEDVEYWKRTAQQYEQTLKAQTELTQTREAALVAKHEAQIRSFTERYRNLVEELAAAKGSIRLMCRIKPEDAPTENSLKFTNGDEQPFLPWGKLRVTYQNESQKTDNRDFDFQRVFGNGESNQEVFEQVKDFAKSAALGNSASIMAYGATGTGKSYLFLAEDGLVLSYIRFLFQLADEERNYNKYDISISAIEIYLNKIYDLLQAPVANQKVEVRLTAESTTKLESEQEAIDIVKQAIDRREAASTKQNATSSRSHFIIAIKISKKSLVNPREKPVESVLSFADLAGSEAAGRNLLAGSSGIQYEQAQDINQGLLDLGKGVRGLATKGPFFASHNLTRALKSSLSPGSRLLLITTVSPLVANQNNTLTTLRWSQDAIGPRPSPARQWPPVATPSRVPLRTSTSNSSSSSARLPPKGLGVIKRDPSPSTSGRPSPPSVRPRPSFSNTPKR